MLHILIRMVLLPGKILLLLLVATSAKEIATDSSNVAEVLMREHQGSKTIKRQVKLYSGSRPTPIICNGEGFKEDPTDCSIFHRCVKSGKGKFVSFRFQCSPGTIYDAETEICNHPEKTRRIACGGRNNRSTKQTNENEIDQEIPTPISTKEPIYIERNQSNITSTVKPLTSYQDQFKNNQGLKRSNLPTSTSESTLSLETRSTTPRSVSFNNHQSTQQSGENCISDGFMGDSENCSKFYRCVGNRRGGFIRYEFLCSDPTIWDEDKRACNHAWNVKRRRCGSVDVFENNIKSKDEDYKLSVSKTYESALKMPSTQTQTQINYGTKVTQTQSQISNGMTNQNQTQINYAAGQDVKQNQTQISYGTSVSQTQTQINYGNKETQTQLQIDHLNHSNQMQSQVSESTSSTTTTTASDSNDYQGSYSETKPNPPNECTESGFVGDTNNCKKFYRCVDNGRGSYTRYEFSCGEGTVWDRNLESCNHAWAVKECGGRSTTTTKSSTDATFSSKIPSTSTTKMSTSLSPQDYYTTVEAKTEDDNEISYGNQETFSTTRKPISPITTVPTQSTTDKQCKSSGFIGSNNDCKKFYRCVDNGNGQFTRYEFSCGEGTMWDPKIEACNHVWAVEKCGGNQNDNIEKEGTSTPNTTQSTYLPSSTTSQVLHQNDDFDTGYGSQQNVSTSEVVTTLTTLTTTEVTTITTTTEVYHSQGSGAENLCKASGFMGDTKDCKKFYRCVDNGNGEYTRYEFSCGEGTVWDPVNKVCNHAWAVEKCGDSSTNEIETTSQKQNTIPLITPTVQNSVTDDDMEYGHQSNVSPLSSTTAQSYPEITNSNLCTSNGFMGDSNDCKRFYRCVDNGNEGFTKYEFTCGEGTVWDSNIDSCNHAWAVAKCGNGSSEVHPETTSQAYPIINDQVNQSGYPVQNEYPEKPEQSSSTSSSTGNIDNTSTKCQQSGFMGDTQNCKKFYRCVEDGQKGYIQYEFTCGEGTVWDQSIQSCNHEWAVISCNKSESNNNTNYVESLSTEGMHDSENQGNNNQQTSEQSPSSTSSISKPSGGVCRQEGFYGDEHNCKNFYRCVNNGQGGYNKYDFTCSDGTIWNQEMQACDHESDNNSCKQPAFTSSTKKPTIQNDEYTESVSESMLTTSSEYLTKPDESQPVDKCKKEGFYGDSKNCKKFYRCVDNGKGDFIKYDFTCGEGTVWVQEIQACDHDNGVMSCVGESSASTQQPVDQSQFTTETTSQLQTTDKENSGNKTESSSRPTSSQCTSEGFYGNEHDCTKFHRCVDNGQGGYTKYEFACGEGTAWDSDLQTCNHISEVQNCNNTNQHENQIMHDDEASQTTESTSTPKEISSNESSNSKDDFCVQEGFYGNTKDCTKFYRCVDSGDGTFTKYDFDCGEGTIWDQDLTTCNHPQDVANPSCKNNEGVPSSTESSSVSNSISQTTNNNGNENSSCTQESTSKKPETQKIKCEKAGYYANPDDCKKFYRCVDWDGNGEKFSVFHFECGEGTIWDPQLDTCNHEDSVYPPRNCSGSQSQSEITTQENTTTDKTTTQESTPSSTEVATEKSTPLQSSSSEQTTQETTLAETSTTQSITSEQTTSESTTYSEQITTEKIITTTQQTTQEITTSGQTTETSEHMTTQLSNSNDVSTTEQSATSDITTSQQTTTSEQTTTQYTTSSEQSTTQQSISEQTTTEQSIDSEITTTQLTTTEQQSTTSEQTSSTTEQTSTVQQVTENQMTTTETTTQTTTTESDSTSTTENNQETTTGDSSNKECPDTEDDQYLYVCPTSFRRHPKYCNMFYQCTEDDDSHEVKIATFTCPNNTIYDESKTQCVDEDKADKKCDGQRARKHRVKRLNPYSIDPIQVDRHKHACTTTGYHPFEKENECSSVFLKCSQTKSGKLRGYVYQCPKGYVYWSISKKCEKRVYMKYCQESSSKNWSNRWEIPVERRNVAK